LPSSAEQLVALLDLETIDLNLFRGTQPDTILQRVFGGQVAAQALVAGARTVDPPMAVHSLHSYFLRPGDTAVPIVYDAERIRDGRSFATRRVVARQHGRPIYYMTASFQVPEDGFEHQDVMPSAIQQLPADPGRDSPRPKRRPRFSNFALNRPSRHRGQLFSNFLLTPVAGWLAVHRGCGERRKRSVVGPRLMVGRDREMKGR
jgi:hypothetical protein